MPRRTTRRHVTAFAIALGAAALLLGCGSDDGGGDETSDAPVTDAGGATADGSDAADESGEGVCELITEDEITEAIGEQPVETTAEEGSGASLPMCEWTFSAPEDSIGVPPTLQLVVMGPDDYEGRIRGGENLFEDLDGYGDEAKWAFVGSEETAYMAQLLVLDGDDSFHLNSGGMSWDGEAEAREALTSFADSVIERR